MLNDWHIILNPSSGSGKGKSSWSGVSKQLQSLGLQFTFDESQYPGNLSELLDLALKAGKRKFISYGGDGTLNAMINAVMRQSQVNPSEILLAHYPAGTGNDWGKTFSNPSNTDEWVEMIKRGKIYSHDVGVVDAYNGTEPITHFFVNIAGMAYDGLVVKKVDLARASKWRFLKKLLYKIVILKEIFNFKAQELELNMDDNVQKIRCLNISIGINQYNGDGMRPCFNADPSDGLLDVTSVEEMGILEAIQELPGMKDGSFAKNPKVSFTQCKEFTCDHSDYPDLIETDGELIGHTPVKISVKPKALRFVVNQEPIIGW
ncbi:MAG: diacylglycerol kinase (ATP) [Granulosicoccus sp.]|jgi:diacylglycerol kinase (ATP)